MPRRSSSIPPGLPKSWRDLVKRMLEAGWTVEKRKHFIFYAPDRITRITIAGSASDHRAVRNMQSIFDRWLRQQKGE